MEGQSMMYECRLRMININYHPGSIKYHEGKLYNTRTIPTHSTTILTEYQLRGGEFFVKNVIDFNGLYGKSITVYDDVLYISGESGLVFLDKYRMNKDYHDHRDVQVSNEYISGIKDGLLKLYNRTTRKYITTMDVDNIIAYRLTDHRLAIIKKESDIIKKLLIYNTDTMELIYERTINTPFCVLIHPDHHNGFYISIPSYTARDSVQGVVYHLSSNGEYVLLDVGNGVTDQFGYTVYDTDYHTLITSKYGTEEVDEEINAKIHVYNRTNNDYTKIEEIITNSKGDDTGHSYTHGDGFVFIDSPVVRPCGGFTTDVHIYKESPSGIEFVDEIATL